MKIVGWQYRELGKKPWNSCGEFTYNHFKDDPAYEVRRLAVVDVVVREGSETDGYDYIGKPL